MTFNSFSINIGNMQYPISGLINDYKYLYSYDLDSSTIKSALNFNNLSKNKMISNPRLNESGFVSYIKYFPFNIIEKDFIGITFDINFMKNEFKVLMIITKNKIKFIPIIFNSTKDGIERIENSKTYQHIKYYMSHNLDFSTTHNQKFTSMLRNSKILDRNSYIMYNIT